MSYNQVRADRSDGGQLRKSGGRGRGFYGGGRGGGRGSGVAASLSSNHSYRKSSNEQGGQSRIAPASVGFETSTPNATQKVIQNGALGPPLVQGSSTSPMPHGPTNPVDTSLARSSEALSKAHPSQSSTIISNSTSPSTPIKGDRDGPKPLPLQFGTISPGIVHGLKVPARTTSAPPNLDEQKQNQVDHNSFKAGPTQPVPSVPKQQPQQTRNETAGSNQFSSGESRPPIQIKRDSQVQHNMYHPPNSSNIPIPGISMPMSFQRPPIPLQFGVPGPQQIPAMPMGMGNVPQIPQQMMFHNIHPHHQMLPHLGFGHPISSSPPQLPNPPYIPTSQFPQHQQQISNFNGARKASNVKITHPDTHEELRLDKATPQSRLVPSFSSTPFFQPTSFNSPSIYFGNNQPMNMGSQPPGFNQPVGQMGHVPVRSSNVQFSQRVGASSVIISKPSSKTEQPKVSEKSHVITTDKKEVVPSKSLESLPKGGEAEMKPNQNEEVDESNSATRMEPLVHLTEGVNMEDAVPKQLTESNENTHDANSLPTSAEESTVCHAANVSSECTINESVEVENGMSRVSELSTVDNIHVKDTPTKVSEAVESVLLVNQESSVEKNDSDKQNLERVAVSKVSEAVESVLLVNQESSVEKNYSDKQNLERVAVSSEATTILEPQKGDLEEKSGYSVGSFSPKVSNHESVISEKTQPDALASETKPMATTELAKAKPISGKKKKMKDILSKADAAGTSDLYNAYKSPDEKQKHPDTSENVSSSPNVDKDNTNIGNIDNNCTIETKEGNQGKDEVDDWEDAEEMPTPKLDNEKVINETIKYTRDFLLTFSEQCVDLPSGFEIGSDIADALLSVHGSGQNSYPSPGKSMDRSPGFSRSDRRGYGMADEAKWKQSGNFNLQNVANQNFRPVQNANYGVLKKPYGQPVNQYGQYGQPVNQYGQFVNQYGQPLLSVPMQSMVSQGGEIRYNSDADRWHSTFGAKGLMIPPPQTPLQIMHKAEKKYEVGKVSDEEQAKQRQLKGILNKLTPQNFERLFQQVKDVNIDNTRTLSGVISQIFDKALMEPTFCEMYADFCYHLSSVLPDFAENEEKISFKRLLLNKCQEEFERGDREAEALRVEEEGENKQTDEGREERRIKTRRRTLGNIRLIGELYKKRMLTERIMHECIQKLLGEQQTPDEEDLEALCKLMSTIGDQIDHPKAKGFMDAYFVSMQKLSTNQKLSSRIRFMIRDVIDLRKNRWHERRKVDGPKKIEEVHRDAARERQSQTNRLTRGPSMGSSSRRVQDYNSRGSSVLPSPTSNRGMPPQHHGYGNQEAKFDDRHPLENRTLSYPLSQRPTDDPITLGPQGGLARGMSKGQPSTPSGPNVYSFSPDRVPHNSRENSMPRHVPDKAPHFTASPVQAQRPVGGMLSDAKTMSEEVLHEKLITTIKEFYSAKDEKEVGLCIKELNSPNFYPSMVSLWVTDSFERKDMERDLLATLLVNLCRSQDNLLSQSQLSQGFKSVLSTLDDAVNDAPRAAEFLGRILVKVILENVLPLKEIAMLVYEGGEEPGSLLESGLASEVLGTVLEIIKIEKGDSFIKDILTTSNLKLEDFKPPHPKKSKKLGAFL